MGKMSQGPALSDGSYIGAHNVSVNFEEMLKRRSGGFVPRM